MAQASKRLATAADIQSIDVTARTVRALVSTGDLVRDNAIVLPSAWQRRIGFYQANPVLLWCHPWSGEAIDRAPWVVIGKAIQIDIEPDGLYCTFQYAYDENPQARLVFDLVAGGYLRAFSVGFQPVRSVKRYSSEAEKASIPEYARVALESGEASEVFTEVELWEVSQVWIGSDRRALAQAVRDGRVDRELVTRAFDGHDPFDRSSTMDTVETEAQEPVARMAVPFYDVAARLHNLARMLETAEYDEEDGGIAQTIDGALNVLAEVSDSLKAMLPDAVPVGPMPDSTDSEEEAAMPSDYAADDEDSFSPPVAVREAAALGLELRQEFGRGGTEVGVARARDLKNGKSISRRTIARMVSYFARHEVDAQADGWEDRENPSAGWIAWLLWGGDPGKRWCNDIWSEIKDQAAGHLPGEAIARVGRPISRSRQEQIEEALSYHERGIEIIRGMLSDLERDDEEMPQGYEASESVDESKPSLDIDAALLRALQIMISRHESQA